MFPREVGPAAGQRDAIDQRRPACRITVDEWLAELILLADHGHGEVEVGDDAESQAFAAKVRELNADWRPGDGVPRMPPPEPEPAASPIVAFEEFWGDPEQLTDQRRRWYESELELRSSLAEKGEEPATWIILMIRSGAWEKRKRQNRLNMRRNRGMLARLRREGYTFDAEHRLRAPALAGIQASRLASEPNRPRESGSRRGTVATRAGPDDSDEPPPPLGGFRLLAARTAA